MRKLPLLLLLIVASTCGLLRAQIAASEGSADVPLIDRAHAGDWVTDIVNGWRTHDGNDAAWANPGFDDSAWKTVELDDMGAASPGWRWYRLHIKLHENHPDLSLLIDGGEGTYELYVNGAAVAGPAIRSQFAVKRPTERIVPLNVPGTDVVLAIRTYTPSCYATWHLPSFLTAAVGTPDAIENERQALQSERLYAVFPVIAINLLIMLAGIGAFALHRSQPTHLEYLWLGIYLFLSGLSAMLWGCQTNGLLPLSANFLVGDPLVYAFTIAQIEFTFSFGGRRVDRAWRAYEALLLAQMVLIWLTWEGHMSSAIYLLIEALILIPVALLLPVLLLLWYRRGNREAGWLILPSLLPAANVTLNGLGTVSIFLGWQRLDFLDNSIPIGAAQLTLPDAGDLLFLLAIVVVMFFRFTRVSRDQARATAELDAAREIQQRLVPASLPALAGYRIEAAYLPAAEVGGDFYQVLEQLDGGALIVVGDVSGKGLKAAMTGALAIGALRTLAAENLGPAALLFRLNRQICATQESGFITCLCARIDAAGMITVANAGHLSPYLGGEEIGVEPGLPLGLDGGVEYSETRFPLANGSVLTLLSDGVVEAKNGAGALFGFERTRAISMLSARKIAEAAQEFGQDDDITVLTIARSAAAAG